MNLIPADDFAWFFDQPPVVETRPASGVTSSFATLRGAVMSSVGSEVTEVGFFYGTDPEVLNRQTRGVVTQYGEFYCLVSDLASDTPYYFMAYATNGSGDGGGDVLTFLTMVDASIPSIFGRARIEGAPILGARVALIDEDTEEFVGMTLTNEFGNFAFTGLDATHLYHVIGEFLRDDGTEFNCPSKPYVSTVDR